MSKAMEQNRTPINLQEFLAQYKEKLPHLNDSHNDSVPFYFASHCSDIPPDIELNCSLLLDQLPSIPNVMNNEFRPDSEIQRPSFEHVPEDKPIPKTYAALKKHKDSSRSNPFSRIQQSYKLVNLPTTKEKGENVSPQLKDYELIVTVRFYRPPRAAYRSYKVEGPVFAEEFMCLGSNYLTELRDKITCICNGKRFVDISNDPEAPLPVLDSDPGYFFIHDTFFNDKRNPKNCDYSETVRNWALKAFGKEDCNFKIKSMESTRFIDLTASLGSPMQYLHHGNCEHLFVFAQLEIVAPKNLKVDRNLYPYLSSFNNYNRRTCYVCGLRNFSFIVEKSRLQLYDPSYLCRNCYYSFYYIDGRKMGNFKAYRIHDKCEELDEEEICENSESNDDEDEDSNIDGNINSPNTIKKRKMSS